MISPKTQLKTLAVLAVVAAGLAISGGVASAHHSGAMFDRTKPITLTGTVKEFQWTNPHSWVQVMVPDRSGKLVEWSVEGGSPNSLSRQGWKRTTMKPGDKIAITINPLKNGEAGGSLVRVKLPDGAMIGRPLPKPQG